MARQSLELGLDLVAGAHTCAGDHCGETAALRPHAIEAGMRVGVAHHDVRGVHGELFGQHLGNDGLGAIADEHRVQGGEDLADRVDTQRNAFGRAAQRESGRSQVVQRPPFGWAVDATLLAGGDPDADATSLGAQVSGLLAPGRQANECLRLLVDLLEVAAVVNVARWDHVRKLIRLDHVLQTQPDHVHAQFFGSSVHQALQHPVGHLCAKAPIRPLLAFVGQSSPHTHAERADPVRSGDLRHRIAVRANPELQVGAVIVDDVKAQRQHRAVFGQREFGVVKPVATVRVGVGEVLQSVFDVLDWLPRQTRKTRGQDNDLVDEHLGPKTAAGRDRLHAQHRGRDAQRAGDHERDKVRKVGVAVNRVTAVHHAVVADAAAGLYGLGAAALPAQPAPNNVIGTRKVFVHWTEFERLVMGLVAFAVRRMDDGIASSLQRGLDVDIGWQNLVFHFYQISRIFGNVAVDRHDGDHHLADMAHFVDSNGALRHRRAGKARAGVNHRCEVGPGVDAYHSRQGLGL